MTMGNLDPNLEVAMYRRMRLMRRFEDRVVELIDSKEIPAHAHEYSGQEAVAVGVCSALEADDVITSTHRGHGHILAKGGDPARMYAELLGRETGYNRGRGGSMHIADLSLGIYGANGIVGAGAPMACGAARIFRDRGLARVAVPFFGDGAVNQGVVLESLNLAAIWKLPVIFVCENNQYAVTTPIAEMVLGPIHERAAAFGLAAESVDGMDVRAVRAAAERAVDRAHDGGGATFLECATYRFSGHFTAERGMSLNYRTDEEREAWRKRDPIERLAAELMAEDACAEGDRAAIDGEVEAELDRAVAFARESGWPAPESAFEFMYATSYPGMPAKGSE